jgi:exopolyphosphatase/pppGpp-phosphohydrolase
VCVNDCAERGVKLIEDFNLTTTDETQKQYLLQVVEAHRKTFHKCNLKELGSMYTDKELHKLHTVSQGLRRFTRV